MRRRAACPVNREFPDVREGASQRQSVQGGTRSALHSPCHASTRSAASATRLRVAAARHVEETHSPGNEDQSQIAGATPPTSGSVHERNKRRRDQNAGRGVNAKKPLTNATSRSGLDVIHGRELVVVGHDGKRVRRPLKTRNACTAATAARPAVAQLFRVFRSDSNHCCNRGFQHSRLVVGSL